MTDAPLLEDVLALPVAEAAAALIGATLLHEGVGGIVVETEAYAPDDPASHSYRGPSPRNAVMFGPPGHAYIYRSYGMHWCLNVTAGGPGAAVLIRALEPTHGIDCMAARRGTQTLRLLAAGPGRLCQALGITLAQNGLAIDAPPFALTLAAGVVPIASGPRIGISKARDVPWRFARAGSRFLSRPI